MAMKSDPIILNFGPFKDFVNNYTSENSGNRYADSELEEIDVQKNYIWAIVNDTRRYTVEIFFTQTKVSNATCSCAYEYGGFCKHIVHVLAIADDTVVSRVAERQKSSPFPTLPDGLKKIPDAGFVVPQQHILNLSIEQIKKYTEDISKARHTTAKLAFVEADLMPDKLEGLITGGPLSHSTGHRIGIEQRADDLHLRCNCTANSNMLCVHLYYALCEILTEKHFQLPFIANERHKLLRQKAAENGWHNITNLDDFFRISISYGRVHVQPKVKLLSYSEKDKRSLTQSLLPAVHLRPQSNIQKKDFVLIEKVAHAGFVRCVLMEAPLGKSGEIKAPLQEVNIYKRLRRTQDYEETLFYVGLLAVNERNYQIEDYQNIVNNPLNKDFYLFDPMWYGEKATPKKLRHIKAQARRPQIHLYVSDSGGFIRLTCRIKVETQDITSKDAQLHECLFIANDRLYCLNNETEAKILSFFVKNDHEIYLQREQFDLFKKEFLDQLENSVTIVYSFIKPAPKTLIIEKSLDRVSKYYIYLSELDEFVLITPAVSYGEVEVPVLSRRTVYTSGPDGKLYSVDRDESLEHRFIRDIQTMHPSFEKLPQTDFFYLHKTKFLDEGWFIQAFEAWRKQGYTILGFNKLRNNRYNEHMISVRTSVQSGIDWFDIHTDISYGEQKVSLRQIQKSIANKLRFVELGDGTQGILPEEWIERFRHYLRAGDIVDGKLQAHKSNFQLIDQLFEQEVLSQEAQTEVQHYKERLTNFHAISTVKIPKKLNATLRDYQKEGLNWLNFLDEFGFGGCLADDMGLGKTVQVIAYFLAQHEKGNTATNLVVVPTSLLFNWQRELEKFAPHLNYLSLHGVKRKIGQTTLANYDIILTTYGTMLSDIAFLKKQQFNIIVLDESQAIKNPDSKRYKAARLLQGRQRLVLTGTPIENNTFDLFAQLSFALPGLLGSAKRFADDYATPIDKFGDIKRAKELQHKIHPFVLRRTKKQVATELPEKTEMVVYCEMGNEQKRVYDTYKHEFQKYLAGLDEDELHSSSLHILQGLTKMRQICNSPALLSDEEFYGDESAKLEELLKQIEKLKDMHKILVFSQFVGMLDLIKKRLDEADIRYAYLTGKTKNREEQVAHFQEDGTIRVFLISLKAGGTGLNLTQAEYVFLIDPWWNPAVENQAIDRAYRIGQQKKVVAVRFITPNSIEEKILDLQQRKKQLADDLIQIDSNMLKQLKKEELMNLL